MPLSLSTTLRHFTVSFLPLQMQPSLGVAVKRSFLVNFLTKSPLHITGATHSSPQDPNYTSHFHHPLFATFLIFHHELVVRFISTLILQVLFTLPVVPRFCISTRDTLQIASLVPLLLSPKHYNLALKGLAPFLETLVTFVTRQAKEQTSGIKGIKWKSRLRRSAHPSGLGESRTVWKSGLCGPFSDTSGSLHFA